MTVTTTTTKRVVREFPREKPGTGIPPKWLEFIWEVQKAAQTAGIPSPFYGPPKLDDAPGGWTERYDNGGAVDGGRSIVVVSYPEMEGLPK